MDVSEFKELVDDYILSEQLVCEFYEMDEKKSFGVAYSPVDSPFGNYRETIEFWCDAHDMIIEVVSKSDNLHELVRELSPLDNGYHWSFYCAIMIACKENPDEQAQAMLSLSGFYVRYREAYDACKRCGVGEWT